jgi:tetratricopeptide (TPR) repeat protein
MSVINQMLKDLEKRTPPMSSDIALPNMPLTIFYSNKKLLKKYSMIGALFFLTMLFVMLGHQFIFTHHAASTKNNSHAAVFVQPKTQLPQMINPPGNTALHLTPSILTGMTLQLDKETTSLRLLLSQDVLYRVMMNRKGQLVLLLENARLVASIPPINTMNSAVKNLQMINEKNGDLKIILTLKPDAELARLELNQAGKLPELQLDLLSTITSDAETNAKIKNTFVEQQKGSIITLRTDISVSEQYQRALQLSTEGHGNDAIKMLTALLAKNPDYVAARESLAALLIAQGNTAQAQQVIKMGLQQRPFYPAYVQLKARMLVNAGKINQALNLLQLAPPTLKADPDYHAFIAALYQRQGQSLFAEKLYEQLLGLQPDNATWWIGLGIALENMGKQTLAMEAYLKASHNDHLNPELKMYAETRINRLQ